MLMDSLEYFKKSYFAVDGLWFLMIEENTSFENALDIDKKVWKIMAKIQARTAKSLGKSFIEGLCLKWDSEGYSYDIKRNCVDISICPWWDIMKKSGRDSKGSKIGTLICPIIYNGWAQEYNVPYTVVFESRICQGDRHCRLRFKKQSVK
jgi:hypothetical protein